MARLDCWPTEWTSTVDRETGRKVRQYTAAPAHSYPLYYFVPSITSDSRYLVFHSERSGSVQLHRMDLDDGTSVQLTEGTTREAGWAIWCEPHVDGIFNHLSALNLVRGEVYYFDHEEIRCVEVESCDERVVAFLPGRIPLGQSAFSPDGRLFAFIDADRAVFDAALRRRTEREASGRFGPGDHDRWRQEVPTRIAVVDTRTGELSTVLQLGFHVHHVLFVDDDTLLVNHEPTRNGMWTVSVTGEGRRSLRPPDAHGAVCHQVIADGALLYETSRGYDLSRERCWFGRYDLGSDTWTEWLLPADIGYVHTGNDPAGTFLFIESASERHALYEVAPRPDEDVADVRLLRRLNHENLAALDQQRHHAHPFLSPDRQQMFFTDVIDGCSQICSLDVSDRTAGPSH
jgi:hypothetical protein